MAQVRSAALTNYFEVARFVGLDPYAMLKRARISPSLLDDPDRRLSRAAVNFLLNESARESNCMSFGLMMAESRALGNMGAIALVLRHQGNVRGVIEALGRYRHMMGDTVTVAIEDRAADVAIRIGIAAGTGTIDRQGLELSMGIMARAIAKVSGGQWQPDAVHFTHAAPGDPAVHNRVFGVPLVFDSDFNGFVSSARALDERYSTADAEMARYAEDYLDRLSESGFGGSVRERVLRTLDIMLPLGRATLEQTSDNLGMSQRTLQRLLEKEGHSFASLLNGFRRERVLEYIANPVYAVGEIARMIGYSTPSSFTRWFYAEFGITPASWRAGERPPEGLPTPPAHPARTSRGARSAP